MDLHDVQAEQRLLGMLMRQPKLWEQGGDRIKPTLFADEFNQRVAEIMCEEAGPQAELVPSRVMRRLGQDGQHRLKDLAGMMDRVLTMDEFEGLVSMLHDLASRRAVLDQLLTKQVDLYDLNIPLNEALGEIQAGMLEAAATHGHDGGKMWDEVLQINYADMINQREGSTETVWPAGLQELGSALKGIRKKHLIVLAGRPSMGKTTFAQFWAVHLARKGIPSCFFCPDQAAEEITERQLWNSAHISGTRWEMAHEWSDAEYQRANKAFSDLYGLPIRLNDRRGMTPDEVCALARKEKALTPELGLIVIDHLTALSFKGDRRMNWSKVVGEAAKMFKNLAEELDVAVVLLSQLNRSLESRDDKRPTMSDLRDSGEIEEHANEILFLYREEYYKPDAHGVKNVCEIHIAKQKQGPRAETACVKFEPEYARFSDLTMSELNTYVNAIEQSKSKGRKGKGAA